MKPYTIVEDNADRTVFEYKTIYVWLLYVIAGFGALGIIVKEDKILIPSLVLFVFYMIFISSQYYQVGKKTKEAMKKGNIEMTGSKWSFRRPLKVSIPKNQTSNQTSEVNEQD